MDNNETALEISVSAGYVKPALNSVDSKKQNSSLKKERTEKTASPVKASEGSLVIADDVDSESISFSREQKQSLFTAISEGDIELVEEHLNIPGASLDIAYYGQNMVLAAIKAMQTEMAEFLIDIGVDCDFASTVFDHKGEHVDCYRLTCRQMAYDNGMFETVDLIDYKNGYKRANNVTKRNMRSLKEETLQNLQKTNETSVLRAASAKSDDTLTDMSGSETAQIDDDDVTFHDKTLEYVTNFMRTRQASKTCNQDEGYISTSPKSSTRSSPISPINGYHLINRHVDCYTDAITPQNHKMCSSHGSYAQESRYWSSTKSSREVEQNNDNESIHEPPPSSVRTLSPWRDKHFNNRRQRRLPATPSSAVNHRPRIMSPPSSQNATRSSRMLLQTNIVTLPNKLSLSSLPNPMSPRENAKRSSPVNSKSRQIPYGKNNKPTVAETPISRKYDEHFVCNTDTIKKKPVCKTPT